MSKQEEKKDTSNGMILESVEGIEIIVDKNKRESNPLPLKEWILAEIKTISKQLPTTKGWHPNLNWEFAIREDGFEKRKIWMNTSMLATLDSKLYNYYLAIMGIDDLADGASIKPSDLIGKLCYIMVVTSKKDKTRQVISDIKHYSPKEGEKEKSVSEVKTSDIKKEAPAKKEVEKNQPEEVNIEEVNFDEL